VFASDLWHERARENNGMTSGIILGVGKIAVNGSEFDVDSVSFAKVLRKGEKEEGKH
jgi:hypothetical protein